MSTQETETVRLDVHGMSCTSCAMRVAASRAETPSTLARVFRPQAAMLRPDSCRKALLMPAPTRVPEPPASTTPAARPTGRAGRERRGWVTQAS